MTNKVNHEKAWEDLKRFMEQQIKFFEDAASENDYNKGVLDEVKHLQMYMNACECSYEED